MKRACSFSILCLVISVLFAACCSPRQAATVLEVSPVYVVQLEHTIEVPSVTDTALLDVPLSGFDPVITELSNTYLKVRRLESQVDSLLSLEVEVTTKPIYITDTIEFETRSFTVRWPGTDSVYQVIGQDTTFLHAYDNDWRVPNAVAEFREVASGDKPPWMLLALALLGLMAWWAKKRDKKE